MAMHRIDKELHSKLSLPNGIHFIYEDTTNEGLKKLVMVDSINNQRRFTYIRMNDENKTEAQKQLLVAYHMEQGRIYG